MSLFQTQTFHYCILETLLIFDKQISLQMLLLANHGRSSYGVLSESITLLPVLDCSSFAAAVTNFKLNFKKRRKIMISNKYCEIHFLW